MNDGIAGAIVIGVIFFGLVSVIRAITDYQLRRKLIQLGHVDRSSVSVLQPAGSNRLSPLKWGLVILFGGIGLIIISLANVDHDSPLPFGIEAVCIAVGFLVYYFISRNADESSDNEHRIVREEVKEGYADAK